MVFSILKLIDMAEPSLNMEFFLLHSLIKLLKYVIRFVSFCVNSLHEHIVRILKRTTNREALLV